MITIQKGLTIIEALTIALEIAETSTEDAYFMGDFKMDEFTEFDYPSNFIMIPMDDFDDKLFMDENFLGVAYINGVSIISKPLKKHTCPHGKKNSK